MSSTLLSLVFVPAVFAVMDDIARWTWRLFGRLVGPAGTRLPTLRRCRVQGLLRQLI